MKSSKGARVVRKRLADGTVKEYRYGAWQPKPSAPRAAPNSLDALLAAYRRSPEWRAKAEATQVNQSIYLRSLDAIGHLPLTEVTRKRLLSIRDAIAAARGNGAGTQFGRTAGALMAWGLDRGWLEFNPLSRLKKLPGGHLPVWTEAEVALALKVLPEAFRRVVVLGAHTAQRRGDLIAMTWAAYDGRTIRVKQQKDKRHDAPTLLIPTHPALRAELDGWRGERENVIPLSSSPSATILTGPRGQPWTAEHLSREMGRELKERGLPGLNVHGLRKVASTRLADAGCSAHEIQAITGHRTLAMVELYTRSADQERLATSAIKRLTTKPRTTRHK